MGTAVFQDGYLILYKLDKEKDIFYDPLDQKNGQTDINPGGMEVKKKEASCRLFFLLTTVHRLFQTTKTRNKRPV